MIASVDTMNENNQKTIFQTKGLTPSKTLEEIADTCHKESILIMYEDLPIIGQSRFLNEFLSIIPTLVMQKYGIPNNGQHQECFIKSVISEHLGNFYKYAYEQEEDKNSAKIKLSWLFSKDKVGFRIENNGLGFDYNKEFEQELQGDLFRQSKRGMLIHSLVNDFFGYSLDGRCVIGGLNLTSQINEADFEFITSPKHLPCLYMFALSLAKDDRLREPVFQSVSHAKKISYLNRQDSLKENYRRIIESLFSTISFSFDNIFCSFTEQNGTELVCPSRYEKMQARRELIQSTVAQVNMYDNR